MPPLRSGQNANTAAVTQTPPPPAPDEHGVFSILFENDIFYNTDRDYTNGVALAYTTAPDDNWDFALRLARTLPFFAQTGDVRTSYSIGQNIYTPSNTEAKDPPLDQRPYAGFLYGSAGLIDDTGRTLDQLEVQLGVVGPASLAQESQIFVHQIVNDRVPHGWHYQLRDEPGLVILYERSLRVLPRWNIAGFGIDLVPHYGAAVGNVYDYANAGAVARFGWNMGDDYGPLRIEPSLPGSGFFESGGDGPVGAYVFAGVDGRAIARDLFLDGNTFEYSRSVDKENFVGDLELGAALTINGVRLAFTHVFRSKEYKTQHAADQFGAVNLSVRF